MLALNKTRYLISSVLSDKLLTHFYQMMKKMMSVLRLTIIAQPSTHPFVPLAHGLLSLSKTWLVLSPSPLPHLDLARWCIYREDVNVVIMITNIAMTLTSRSTKYVQTGLDLDLLMLIAISSL